MRDVAVVNTVEGQFDFVDVGYNDRLKFPVCKYEGRGGVVTLKGGIVRWDARAGGVGALVTKLGALRNGFIVVLCI